MKRIQQSLLTLIGILTISSCFAQTKEPDDHKIAVLGIDAIELAQSSESIAHITRLKLQQVPHLSVLRHYDVLEEFAGQEDRLASCFSVKCLSELGAKLGADQMLSGSVERFGERIVVNLVLIDVEKQAIVASDVNEYYNLGSELEGMMEISVNNLFQIESESGLKNALERKESVLSDQVVERLNLNGPRMGIGYVGGEQGQRLADPRNERGFDMLPIMTQFGYQMEWQYMSAGNLQALVEVIPIISGMDQGRFIPSLTIMNGFRHSKTGVEFAFGPTFRVSQIASGYYDENNIWRSEGYWAETQTREDGTVPDNPHNVHQNIDSKGWHKLSYGFTVAAGKTFKSGHLNVPVNAYFTPNRHGFLVGASFGFNVRKKSRQL